VRDALIQSQARREPRHPGGCDPVALARARGTTTTEMSLVSHSECGVPSRLCIRGPCAPHLQIDRFEHAVFSEGAAEREEISVRQANL
jgi:hypothetical protein